MKTSPIQQSNATVIDQNGWALAGQFGDVTGETAVLQNKVGLIDITGSGLVRIEGKGAAEMLGAANLANGSSLPKEGGTLYRIRQDLFFVHSGVGNGRSVADAFTEQANASEHFITITNVTNGNSALLLIGPQSSEVLSCLCALDLHDSQFPNGTAKMSSVAKTRQLIIRQDMNGIPAYHLLGGRSFGHYLWETIIEAGEGLGLGIAGLNALEALKS